MTPVSTKTRAPTTPQPDGLAGRDAEARRLHAEWQRWKARVADHRAAVERDRERLTVVRAEHVAAQVEADEKRVVGLRAERAEIEERLATADGVEAGLVERARAAGLVWSSAWTAWSDALRAELFDGLAAQRAAVEAAVAAAAEEYERRAGEMPA